MTFFSSIFSVLEQAFKKLLITKSDYYDAQFEIRESNRNMISIVSLLTASILFVLFLLSFIKSPWMVHNLRLCYIVFFFYLILIFFLSHILLPKQKRLTSLLVYILLSITFIFGIFDSITTDKFSDCVVFCVIQVVAPALFIDRFTRMFIFCLFWTLVNSLFTYLYKPPMIASLDYLHMICFLLIGAVLHAYLSSLKIRGFILQLTISTERDRDALTGLYNKSALQREIKQNLLKNKSNGILLIFDVDNFKTINDSFGHDVGDLVLKNISDIFTRTFRRSDIIGRFGGDEFVIFMTMLSDTEIAKVRATQALEEMNRTPVEGDPNLFIHGSFGIAAVPAMGQTYDELFKRADKALYESKNKGKNRISIDGVGDV